jgi:hypothetical protein
MIGEPALTKCYFCGGPGAILIATKDRVDVARYHGQIVDMSPCSRCQEHMKIGVILISIRDGEAAKGEEASRQNPRAIPNPYRTGRVCVIRNEAAERLFKPDHPALKLKWCFVEDGGWQKMGLLTTSTDCSHPDSKEANGPWAVCKVCGTWRRVNDTWSDGTHHDQDEIHARCLTCHPNEDDQKFTTEPHVLELYAAGPKSR